MSRRASVTIPARNAASTIAEQLDALSSQASECEEIVVVDNGSTDGTRDVIDRFRGRISNLRVVDGAELNGIVEVRNAAAAAIRGDLLCCDADDVVGPGWVAAMIAGLDEYDIVGGSIDEHSLNGASANPRTDQADGLPVPWDHLPYSIGANTALRREVIDAVGGWNTDYRFAGEDIDLCWRAISAGYRIGFRPDAIVRYRHRRELSATRRQAERYGRASAKLHRDHRSAGLRRGPISGVVRSWGKVVLLAPAATVRPQLRIAASAAVGYAWGTTAGMVTERVWPY